MINLNPVSETDATGNIQRIYTEIKDCFELSHVPLLFQYLATDEEYFAYIWEKIRQNSESETFVSQKKALISFARQSVGKLYTPTEGMRAFADSLSDQEKIKLQNDAQDLTNLNATLLLISFALRESIKGIPFEQLQIEGSQNSKRYTKERENTQQTGRVSELAENEMHVVLFGSTAPEILPYPRFFTLLTEEMEALQNKDAYLHVRVGIEQVAQISVAELPYPMRTSLRELSEMIPDTEKLYALLLILKHRFPPLFPHLLLTSVVMEKLLSEEKELVV